MTIGHESVLAIRALKTVVVCIFTLWDTENYHARSTLSLETLYRTATLVPSANLNSITGFPSKLWI
jgi:hypothetical protein